MKTRPPKIKTKWTKLGKLMGRPPKRVSSSAAPPNPQPKAPRGRAPSGQSTLDIILAVAGDLDSAQKVARELASRAGRNEPTRESVRRGLRRKRQAVKDLRARAERNEIALARPSSSS